MDDPTPPIGRRATDRAPPSLLAKINTGVIALIFTILSGAVTFVVKATLQLSAAQAEIAALEKDNAAQKLETDKLQIATSDNDRRLASASERIATLEGLLQKTPPFKK